MLVKVAVATVSLFLSPAVVNSEPANAIESPYVLVKLFAVTVRLALLTVNPPFTYEIA